MAKARTVWGIDIGQCALKALKLREAEGELQVDAFDIIEHPKVLSQPDADRRQLVANALEQFLARNNVADSTIAVAVPGQSSFTRFIKLPPVETKKIPDIVRFEAEQQIPFPIDDVIWRWQTFQDPDSPDVELGIFAMKQVDVADVLAYFTDVEMTVHIVQMAPLALYNFLNFDGQLADAGATLLADVGADKTDLVVADGARIWTRTIQIGGNNFTEALVRAFKLSFSKAEKLKRAAAGSKYARQIFQTMRPVFADLHQEIQRSIGYYTSLHRETRFQKVVGLGNGFRLPGLQKFLEQNLNIPVVRIDTYNQLTPSAAVNAPTFTDNVLSFAVAYGLAVQGLGESVISTNLLPGAVSRRRRWQRKRPWFATAAAVLLALCGMWLIDEYGVKETLAANERNLLPTERQVERMQQLHEQFRRATRSVEEPREANEALVRMFRYRDFWPAAQSLIQAALGQVASEQRLYNAMLLDGDEDAQKRLLAQLQAIPRGSRRLVFIEQWRAEYRADVSAYSRDRVNAEARAALGIQAGVREPTAVQPAAKDVRPTKSSRRTAQPQTRRGFLVTVVCRTPIQRENDLLRNIVEPLIDATERLEAQERLKAVAFRELGYARLPEGQTWSLAPSAPGLEAPSAGAGPAHRYAGEVESGEILRPGFRPSPIRRATPQTPQTPQPPEGVLPDPVFAGEYMDKDSIFAVTWLLTIEDDGVVLPEVSEAGSGRR
jgi:type IV pilus assembly protein PilM